ncbi:MAG TPA: aminotransferase class III-fold pyridoxal phosphate-dependent enzyme [Candidatus Nanopelagicales bacterium]|nr:aminotransferase class III-fold pyridoxal phosphate-dependent enzyme [Candidatus Nanopelagicales bacterium]
MSLLDHTPTTTATDAERIVREVFGLEATATDLPSERDRAFRVEAADGSRWVLKVSNALEDPATLAVQTEVAALAKAAGLPVQGLERSLSGEEVPRVDGHLVRLLEWLPGTLLGDVDGAPAPLLQDVGSVLGRLAAALEGYDHPAAHRDFYWDVLSMPSVVRDGRASIADPSRRALMDTITERWASYVEPRLPDVRHAVIHGDANDNNVVVDPGSPDRPAERFVRVAGLIDFGDLVHSALPAEIAVAASYHMVDARDPVEALAQIVRGFHEQHPLTEVELEVLWDLVLARLVLSGVNAAVQSAQRPGDAYLTIDESTSWEALAALVPVPRERVLFRLRDVCGLDPHPDAGRVRAHLAASTAYPLLGTAWDELPLFALDLSVGSDLFGAADVGAGPERFDRLIRRDVAPDAIGVGGYGEARLLYTTPEFAPADAADEARTVHLGTDVWTVAGAPLHAPHASRVHRVHDNALPLDYGPVVILEHTTGDGVVFYSLYGHLAVETLEHVREGQELAAGEVFGWIGSPPRNGDWAPHVHVQVILDLLDLDVDYPGVAKPSQRTTWLGLSPDPALLLGLPDSVAAVPEHPIEDTAADRARLLGPNLSVSYAAPLRIVRGVGVHLYDDLGRAYLDSVNNVCHVGHANPYVVRAGQRQMQVLNTNTRYLHDEVLRYAGRITATLPEPLSVCFFVNSGSEANELAIRLVRAATGRHDMVCVEHGYHGHNQTLIDVSPYKHAGRGGRGAPSWVHVAAMPDPYRGEHRGYAPAVGRAYADDVARAAAEADGNLAGWIVESMIGCGGQVVLPDGYLLAGADAVRARGGLVIADEVQVGFGRVGPEFWGFATQGVVPDVVTFGKPAGNGHPLAGVVTTPEIAAAFANGMEYFNTFGGNPVSAAIGNAVLDVIEREDLPGNAQRVGRRILAGAIELATRHEIIGDARGLGLYIGIELVRDRETLEPADAEAAYVVERCKDLGVLVSIDGPFHNVLKIKPPIVWTDSDADRLITTLDRVLAEQPLRR